MSFVKFVLIVFFVSIAFEETVGHGMMMDPPNRSSLWRFDHSAPINYNDNENFCGGFGFQWDVHNGSCGVCGDNFGDAVPRKNENTGKYGQGKVVAKYPSGSTINITVILTSNHKGWFNYSICDLKDPSQPESEDCFKGLLFEDGSAEVKIEPATKNFYHRVRLPAGLRCDRCVLRWSYRAGNRWGICPNGKGATGCGPQETFQNCADISVI